MANNMENLSFDYGFYSDGLRECAEKFGDLFVQPIISSPYIEITQNYTGGNILDIGAGKEKPLYACIKDKLAGGSYFSLDTDPKGKFDFADLRQIPENLKFSLIVANQFFEHLDVGSSMNVIRTASAMLKQGGS